MLNLSSIDSGALNRLFATAMTIVVILLIGILIYWVMRRRYRTPKLRRKLRSRLAYVAVSILVVALIQIWVEGFNHLLTVLSLVATGLVISNKETVMNLVGWLIINWRGIFSEGENIRIGEYVGLVHNIRPFYFELYETVGLDSAKSTGRAIKIPNSLIITQPVKTTASDKNIRLFTLSLAGNWEASQLSEKLTLMQSAIDQVIHQQYARKRLFSTGAIAKQDKTLARLMDLKPQVVLAENQDKLPRLKIQVRYYAYAQDKDVIETTFWMQLTEKNIFDGLMHD